MGRGGHRVTDRPGDDDAANERIEIGGIAGGLSLSALRAMLDPSTREAATIDIDLSQIQVTLPAAALQEIVARAVPQGSLSLRENGVVLKPGGGSPGLNIGVPGAGVRVRVGTAGIHVETD
jgi:hypothetical protein